MFWWFTLDYSPGGLALVGGCCRVATTILCLCCGVATTIQWLRQMAKRVIHSRCNSMGKDATPPWLTCGAVNPPKPHTSGPSLPVPWLIVGIAPWWRPGDIAPYSYVGTGPVAGDIAPCGTPVLQPDSNRGLEDVDSTGKGHALTHGATPAMDCLLRSCAVHTPSECDWLFYLCIGTRRPARGAAATILFSYARACFMLMFGSELVFVYAHRVPRAECLVPCVGFSRTRPR